MRLMPRQLTYANVMSSLAVFLVLGGATAFAAQQLDKNSVGKKQLKNNAVTTAKIKKNAVTTAKIKSNAVTTAKIKNDAVTGDKVNEATLGTVPSATSANNLVGLTRFNFKLAFGGSQTFLTAGPFSFTASCLQNASDLSEPPNPGLDIARILISTNTSGVVFDASGALRGEEPGKFLDTTTPEKERVFLEYTVPTGKASYEADFSGDGGAYSPNGVAVSFNTDGLGTGINVFGPGCFFHGFAVVES
jgi:hypothetical protein